MRKHESPACSLPQEHTFWQNSKSWNETSLDQIVSEGLRGCERLTKWGSYTPCLSPRLLQLTTTPHLPGLFLGAWAYQLSCQTLLRAKCIDWFLIAPELAGERKWGKAFVFLFSNLTQIRNLSAIYIIPFPFINYEEESISLDKNTLKQLNAFILTFHPALIHTLAFFFLVPPWDYDNQYRKYECNSSVR